MNVEKAAELTLDHVNHKAKRERNGKGTGIHHAAWMLHGIAEGYVQNEKAHRWLGYAQGVLVQEGLLTLDDAKTINRT